MFAHRTQRYLHTFEQSTKGRRFIRARRRVWHVQLVDSSAIPYRSVVGYIHRHDFIRRTRFDAARRNHCTDRNFKDNIPNNNLTM